MVQRRSVRTSTVAAKDVLINSKLVQQFAWAYQPPASSTFLSDQTSHQQLASQ
jgi:hypothetical protein